MLIVIIILLYLMFRFPTDSFNYATNGLLLWFHNMIPVLFPFMILSGFMIRQNISGKLMKIFYPVLKRIFPITQNGAYTIIMGFLCGFPMGAKIVSELYSSNKLSKEEAQYLLSFCNNIGPIYFITYLLPTIGIQNKSEYPVFLFGMYGIPLLYGMINGIYSRKLINKNIIEDVNKNLTLNTENVFQSIQYAMQSSIHSITMLGGYMIIFNLCNLFIRMIQELFPTCNNIVLLAGISSLLEITQGVNQYGSIYPFLILSILPIGGCSCLAQTKSIINETDLSMKKYLLHKCFQTIITICFYTIYLLLR